MRPWLACLVLLGLLGPCAARADEAADIYVQQGHTGQVHQISFSADGSLLASGGRDGVVRVWEVQTGRLLSEGSTSSTGNTLKVAFSPQRGSKLLALGQFDTIVMWDGVARRKLREIEYGGDEGGMEQVLFSPDGELVIAAANGSFSGDVDHLVRATATIRAFSAATGARRWNISVPGCDIRKLSITLGGLLRVRADRRYNGPAGTCGTLYFSLATGAQATAADTAARPIPKAPDGSVSVLGELSPDAGLLAQVPEKDKTSVVLWDLRSGSVLHHLTSPAAAVRSAEMTPDGTTLVAGGDDGRIRLWDLRSGKLAAVLPDLKKAVGSLRMSPDGRWLASQIPGAVQIWDLATRSLRFTLNGTQSADVWDQLAISPDGRLLAANKDDEQVGLYELASGRELRTLPGLMAFGKPFSPDGTLLATLRPDRPGGDRAVSLWSVQTGEEAAHLKFHHIVSGTVVKFSPDGTEFYARSLYGAASWKMGRRWSGSRKPSKSLDAQSDSNATDAFTKQYFQDGNRTADGRFGIDTTPAVGLFDWQTRKPLFTFYAFRDGSTLTLTPQGYYDAEGESAESHLIVRVGAQVFDIGQYREKFYRPDLVARALSGDSLEDLPQLGKVALAPALSFVEAPPASIAAESLQLRFRVRDNGGGVGRVRVFLNGSAILENAGARGLSRPETDAGVRSIAVPLVNGRNQLRIVAFNAENTMESNPITAVVDAAFAGSEPRLHALLVGVKDFRNPALQLNYTVADAELIGGILRERVAPLYREAEIRVLTTPSSTTRDGIIAALTEARDKVRPQDLFVFFIASHGTVDEDEYFVLTSNVGSVSTQALRRDALNQAEIKELLASVPSTKKFIVVDTCNAGAIGSQLTAALATRGLTQATAMKLLSRAVGSTVLSASSSTQEAIEGYKGHGLLSYVLGAGLTGSADADKDGFVTTLEIASYVDAEVPQLAESVYKRAQYPLVSPIGQGFPIARSADARP